jgi:hypothetical protein
VIGSAAAAGQSTVIVSRELIDAATTRGALRVVVQIKVADGADPVAIGAAKQALWSDLAGTLYRVIRDLPGLPAVTLEASPATLHALGASPYVRHVSEDQVRRPQR